ncbi:MAG: NUDIX domain-containing protein [Planctomycetes bacterium]|nr:NUDIX domain-containing protein [Planctomycetota bacterium]
MPMPDFLRAIRASHGHGLVTMPAVSAVVRDEASRVLVMRRADTGEWSLPSGICEPAEAPARTLVRELWEETGLRCVPARVLAVFHTPEVRYPNGDLASYVSLLFEARAIGGELHARDGEALELRFAAVGELPRMAIVDWLPAPLDALLAEPAGSAVGKFAWDPGWLAELA